MPLALLYAFRRAHFVLVFSFIAFERGSQLVLHKGTEPLRLDRMLQHQILFGVTLPGSLRSWIFVEQFNQGLVVVTLPSSIQNLDKFGFWRAVQPGPGGRNVARQSSKPSLWRSV